MANPNKVVGDLLGSPVDPVVERSTDGHLWTRADSGHVLRATDNRSTEQPQDAPLDIPSSGNNIVDFSQRGGTVIEAMMKEGGDYQAVNREEVEEHPEKQVNQQPASDLRHRRSFIRRLLDYFRIFFQRLCDFFVCRSKARKEDLSQKEDLLKNESPEPKKEEENPADKLSSKLSEPGQDETTAKYGNGTAADDIVKQEYSVPITSDAHITESSSDKVFTETKTLTSKTNDHAKPDSTNVETVEPTEGLPRDGSPKDGSPRDGSPRDGSPKDSLPRDGSPKDSLARDAKDVQDPNLRTEAVTDIETIPESSQLSAQTAAIVHDQEPIPKSPDTFETPSTEAREKEPSKLDTETQASKKAKDEPTGEAEVRGRENDAAITQVLVVSNEAPAGSEEELFIESAVCGSPQQKPIENGQQQEKDRFVDKSGVFVASAEGQIVEEPRPSDWGEGQPDVVITKPMRSFQPGVHGVFFADNRGYAEELPRPPEWGPVPEDPTKRVVKFEDASWAVAPRPLTAVIPSTDAGVADAAQVDVQESSASGNPEAMVESNGNQEVAPNQLATSAKDQEEIDRQEKDRFLDKSGVFVVRDDGQTLEEPRPNNWGEGQPDLVITKPRRPSQPGTPGVHGVFFADNHGYAEELPRPSEWGPEPEDPSKRLVKFEDSFWAVAPRPIAAIIPSSSSTRRDVASAGDNLEALTAVSNTHEVASSDSKKVTSLNDNEEVTSTKDQEEINRQEKDRFSDKSGIFVVRDDGQTMEEPRPNNWGEVQPDVVITKPRRPSQPGTPGVRGVFFADNRGYAEELPRPPEWGPEPEDPTKRLVKFEDSSWAVAPRPVATIIPSSPRGFSDCRASPAADNDEIRDTPNVTAAPANEIKAERERAATRDEPDEVEVEHGGVGEAQHSETCFQTASTAHARVIEEVTSCDFPTDVTDEIDYSEGHALAKSHGVGIARDQTVKTVGEDETVNVTDGYGIDADGDHEWHLKDGERLLHTTDKEQTAQREQTSEGGQRAGGREATSDRAEWYSPERNPFEGSGVLVDRINKATIPETLQHRDCAADSKVLLSEHVHGNYSFQRDF